MNVEHHSIRINEDKCLGCVPCMISCPTRAIRIRHGKAELLADLCIDCGECIRFCPHDAIESQTTSFQDLDDFDYKVAIPSTVLYGQFKATSLPNEILLALRRVGFDYVYELSTICELNNAAIDEYLEENPDPRPLISSTCPVVIRLIQQRFPALCRHIIPLEPPREIAAKILRTTLPRALKLSPDKIGIIHITPCPAKIFSINHPATRIKSDLDGAISIRDIHRPIVRALRQKNKDAIMCHLFPETPFSGIGVGWSLSGGETRGLKNRQTVAVSGIRDTIRVLEEVESGLLANVDMLECMACPDGCVGGPLAVENRFLAKSRILRLVNSLGERTVVDRSDMSLLYHKNFLSFDHSVNPLGPVRPDPGQETEKVPRSSAARSKILRKLPKKDCGACGAPDCRTLAEDILRGQAELTDCPFIRKEKP
jgi:iron only hydrogenase large subunit-like protein